MAGRRTLLSPVLQPSSVASIASPASIPPRSRAGGSTRAPWWSSTSWAFAFLYLLLRLQDLLPLNPQGMAAVAPDLAGNTAVSFLTNTNWQNYGGESTMSYLSQMAGLSVQNFLSAATGIALAVALVRGFARAEIQGIGNFWADLVRVTLYVLLPFCLLLTVFYVWQGVPQNLSPYVEATTLEGAKQTIAQGPVASQLAIKMLGTNCGGFFNANSAHPYENPTALANLVQMLSIFAIGAALTNVFGRAVATSARAGRSWPPWGCCSWPASSSATGRAGGNPLIAALGVDNAPATWRARRCASARPLPPCSR